MQARHSTDWVEIEGGAKAARPTVRSRGRDAESEPACGVPTLLRHDRLRVGEADTNAAVAGGPRRPTLVLNRVCARQQAFVDEADVAERRWTMAEQLQPQRVRGDRRDLQLAFLAQRKTANRCSGDSGPLLLRQFRTQQIQHSPNANRLGRTHAATTAVGRVLSKSGVVDHAPAVYGAIHRDPAGVHITGGNRYELQAVADRPIIQTNRPKRATCQCGRGDRAYAALAPAENSPRVRQRA